jgi:hypothetical protein
MVHSASSSRCSAGQSIMMIRRMRAHGERQSMPIHNREDFHTLSLVRETHGVAAFGDGTRRIDNTLAFVDRPSSHSVFANCVRISRGTSR